MAVLERYPITKEHLEVSMHCDVIKTQQYGCKKITVNTVTFADF